MFITQIYALHKQMALTNPLKYNNNQHEETENVYK